MTNYLSTKKILSYDDVVGFDVGNSSEELIDVRTYDNSIIVSYIKHDMLPITGDEIYARISIAKKLARIENKLKSDNLHLKITYGYRHPDIQKKYFDARKAALAADYPNMDQDALNHYTHNFVAIPEIAGHPAGAAVDLTIEMQNGKELDMGTKIADYSDEEKIRTFSKNITAAQHTNRIKLHDLMIAEGFAPFYGEWWHFSYGDREWAAFYNKKALYGAIKFKTK